MEALYVAGLVYFPDELAAVQEADRQVVIVWMVPITCGEAEFVAAEFEELLVERDPGLMDLSRRSVV
ncbi:hypothetical protein ACI2LF_16690 [Kribbella sp. NPDC020789]